MEIRILAGGPVSLVPELRSDGKNVTWVGVDRGMYQLNRRGIQPDYGFGDFDSLSVDELRKIQTESKLFTFPAEKDKTDLELAVEWAIHQRPESITLFGATGGRLDHEWVNIRLLKKSLGTGIEMAIVDRQNEIIARKPGCYRINRDTDYPYLSFLPFGESIKGLSLEGFKYPLSNVDVDGTTTLTVSNELIEKSGTYSFTDGIVLVIRSRDYS
ncbi:MAG TPA: thiamine diphosphokinase [Bacillales bacterium]|nr:thiamine diphosphokinase [Bacillales bacterium]